MLQYETHCGETCRSLGQGLDSTNVVNQDLKSKVLALEIEIKISIV